VKITGIKTFIVPPRWLFLKIETDEGVSGWGEAILEGGAQTVAAAVDGLTGGVFNFVGNLAAIVVPVAIGFLVRGQDFTRPLIFISVTALLGAFSYRVLVGNIERVAA
jgi:L-alanine-DL-glutamate epimerase-like enolase superfamily enzyme